MSSIDQIKREHSDIILNAFGQLLFNIFDESLYALKFSLTSSKISAYQKFHQILEKMSPEERIMAAAQYSLETFIHNFMATLQENDSYAIVAKIGSDGLANIRNLTQSGLEQEQADWQEKYSKHDSVSQQIV